MKLSREELTRRLAQADRIRAVLRKARPRSSRYAREAVARAPAIPLRERPVSVLTPEDFVLFKALSTWDRDLDDAAAVLRRSREALDLDWIAREVESLAGEIPDFDVRSRFQAIRERAGPRL